MECFVHADKKYFPEYNWLEKAISYPYKAPTTSFTFKNGKFYQGIHISLKDRVPIISIGSNRSPYQLKNKFGVKENLCVTPTKLYNSVIVYAASMSAYGSIPATQWPCEGSVSDLNLLWLNQDQLQIMHLSEGLGIAYHSVQLDKNTVTISTFFHKAKQHPNWKDEVRFQGDQKEKPKRKRSELLNDLNDPVSRVIEVNVTENNNCEIIWEYTLPEELFDLANPPPAFSFLC